MRPTLLAFLVIALCPALWGETATAKSPQICVAQVANASAVSADLGRLTERLVKSLKRDKKQDALAMDSSTAMSRRLQPTRENSDEADAKECDYVLLTRIVESRAHPAMPATMHPSGPVVPNIDASDTRPGSSSEPVYREEMQISFALFRVSHLDPVVDTDILEAASANVSDTFMAAMDRVASRVTHELKRK